MPACHVMSRHVVAYHVKSGHVLSCHHMSCPVFISGPGVGMRTTAKGRQHVAKLELLVTRAMPSRREFPFVPDFVALG